MRAHASLGPLIAIAGLVGSACDDGASLAPNAGMAADGGGGSGGSGGEVDAGLPPIQHGLDISTRNGRVRGATVGTTRVFQGIPYAEPPVGERRWRAPEPASAWDGVLDATAPGPICPQFLPVGGNVDPRSDEDCLSLHVWTPSPAPDARLPVMVWIHGGAFEIGSASDAQYDGRRLSERGNVVVVGINYRLGPLGWLAHPALKADGAGAGNWGLRDQQLALRWVQDEIAAFGGDPDNVTVFGESAGAMSACVHLVAPGSRDAAHRVVMQSGACIHGDGNGTPVQSVAEAHETGTRFVKGVGCDGADDVAGCLRALGMEDVLRWTENAADFLSGLRWGPVIDGEVIPEAPEAMIAAGDWSQAPVLLGTNRDEFALFVAPPLGMPIATRDDYVARIEAMVPAGADEVLAQYPAANDADANGAYIRLMSDLIFTCPARTLARATSDADGATFLYSFEEEPGDSIFGDIGVFHAAEIPFVFDTKSPLGSVGEASVPLSHAMQHYWANFARAGDPNGDPLDAWPRYDARGDAHMVLALPLSTSTGLREDACDFWDAFRR